MNKELCKLLGEVDKSRNSDIEFRYFVWEPSDKIKAEDKCDDEIKRCKYAIINFRYDSFIKNNGEEFNLLVNGLNVENDIISVKDITHKYKKQSLNRFRDSQFYNSWTAQFE